MGRFQRLMANLRGRDLAVGDIHGHFQRLQQCLDAVGFDPAVDRLFSVGDLVDRGPDSGAALQWLAQPWFHAVQGNHEALAITRVRGGRLDLDMYRAAGGGWFLDLPRSVQLGFVERFEQLPVAIEVESAAGLVGLLHADSPFADWAELRHWLELHDDPKVREVCQWSRRRLKVEDSAPVQGLRALLVGHTPVREAKLLGNVWHLDTGGWASGHFTLMDMRTLQLVTPGPGDPAAPPPTAPA
ncbi:serine/threonine protein phosphatase [Pseudomonas sp. LB-090624]|uniref:metallophosphoesterase n=1 Tax=Pseudomonas sp. LB-090624 TaxID=2213079 RepID=UPI000D99FE18|nr:metallophosphoesterase [Pseudomonas sp. LB-090624]PYB73874.1 serine/threonine protein phosphatase [Pseudomonas sp. LB-090624]